MKAIVKAIVKDVMSAHPISVPETAKVKRLAATLRQSRVLTGIISRTDVLAVYDRLDEEIRVEIISQVIPGSPSRAGTRSS
jgi:hypothetical protein